MGGRGTGIVNERERIFRINEFWQFIIDNNGKEKAVIIAKFSFKYGLTDRKIKEYLKVLVLNGKVDLVDGCLVNHNQPSS